MDFMDRESYYRYAINSSFLLEKYSNWGIVPLLANEPLWLLINGILSSFLSPESTLRCLIFFPATIISWIVLIRYPKYFFWIMLFLMYPAIIKNHIIHLRQGVAIAIFLIGWFCNNSVLRWIVYACTPFVHGSFLFICAILFLSRMLTFIKFGYDLRSGIFLSISVGLGMLFTWLVNLVGARQGGYNDFSAIQVSGLGFIFWSLIFSLWLFQGKKFLRTYVFESGVLLIYLGTYWTITVSARIFESGILLILIAGLSLTGWRKQLFLTAFLMIFLSQWLIYMNRPGFGFIAS